MMLRYESSGFKIESGADFRRIFLLGNSQSAIAEASIRDSLLRSELKERTSEETKSLERETGFEPATSTLARSHSTTELLPLGSEIIN